MKYRSDIDGLRAIAVVSVVLFHFGILSRFFGGGYVGVDIFFVISGYLITKALLNQIESNQYSIIDFYHRRIRRIFPALFFVYTSCLAASYILDLHNKTKDVTESIVSSIFFLSNIYFLHSAGYFDQSLQSNPVLHTWSLSVEEQFYIFIPFLLIKLRKWKKIIKPILVTLCVTSFIAASLEVRSDASSAFYLVQYRSWELLVGSLLAAEVIPPIHHKKWSGLAGTLGLTLIFISITGYSKSTLFPGESALLPCIGTAAIIHAGTLQTNKISQLLGSAPLRFIGLISYSLYLSCQY